STSFSTEVQTLLLPTSPGNFFSQESLIYSYVGGYHSLSFLCPTSAASVSPGSLLRYNFTILLSGSTNIIRLDLLIANATYLIGYLPYRITLTATVTEVLYVPSSGTSTNLRSSSTTLFLTSATTTSVCGSLPTTFPTGQSSLKSFDETIFALKNFITFGCSSTPSSYNATSLYVSFFTAKKLLANDSSIASDLVLVAPTLASVEVILPSSGSISGNLTDTIMTLANIIQAYDVMSTEEVSSLTTATETLLNQMTADGVAQTVQTQLAAESAMLLLAKVGTSFCAQETSNEVTTTAFQMSAVKSPANVAAGFIQLSSTASVSLTMSSPSSTGYCFVSILGVKNPLTVTSLTATTTSRAAMTTAAALLQPNNNGPRFAVAHRHGAQELAAAVISPLMNMPLFTIATDPFATAFSSTLSHATIQYTYPSSLQPTSDANVVVELYWYNDGVWVPFSSSSGGGASITTTFASRLVVIQITALPTGSTSGQKQGGAASIYVSGIISFVSTTTAPSSEVTWDIPVLALGCGFVALCAASMALSSKRSAERLAAEMVAAKAYVPEAEGEGSNKHHPNVVEHTEAERTLLVTETLSVHLLWLPWGKLIPNDPVTMPIRWLTIFQGLGVSYIAVVLLMHRAAGGSSATYSYGVLVGLTAAALSSLNTWLLRPLLSQQIKYYAAFSAWFLGCVAGGVQAARDPDAFYLACIPAAIVSVGVYLLASILLPTSSEVSLIARWQPRIAMFLTFCIGAVCVIVAAIFGTQLTHPLKVVYNDQYLVLITYAWSVVFYLVAFESFKHALFKTMQWKQIAKVRGAFLLRIRTMWKARREQRATSSNMHKHRRPPTTQPFGGGGNAPPTAALPHHHRSHFYDETTSSSSSGSSSSFGSTASFGKRRMSPPVHDPYSDERKDPATKQHTNSVETTNDSMSFEVPFSVRHDDLDETTAGSDFVSVGGRSSEHRRGRRHNGGHSSAYQRKNEYLEEHDYDKHAQQQQQQLDEVTYDAFADTIGSGFEDFAPDAPPLQRRRSQSSILSSDFGEVPSSVASNVRKQKGSFTAAGRRLPTTRPIPPTAAASSSPRRGDDAFPFGRGSGGEDEEEIFPTQRATPASRKSRTESSVGTSLSEVTSGQLDSSEEQGENVFGDERLRGAASVGSSSGSSTTSGSLSSHEDNPSGRPEPRRGSTFRIDVSHDPVWDHGLYNSAQRQRSKSRAMMERRREQRQRNETTVSVSRNNPAGMFVLDMPTEDSGVVVRSEKSVSSSSSSSRLEEVSDGGTSWNSAPPSRRLSRRPSIDEMTTSTQGDFASIGSSTKR
ncbi:transmembrane protein, putative, partial [Bodo saltans]